jgi:hypothetical protein
MLQIRNRKDPKLFVRSLFGTHGFESGPDMEFSLTKNQKNCLNLFYFNGDVVAQLAKARLGEPDCNAAVPGSIPASSTVS